MHIPSLFIKNAALAYENTLLFKNINLNLPAKQSICLLGPSGVGKSSLLRLIANLIQSSKDVKLISGIITSDDNINLDNRIAYMAQSDNLLPWLSVEKNITLGARLRREKIDSDKLEFLLKAVDLLNAKHKLPAQLSGGMRQRTALARTLYEDKPIVLMDEPFSALDIVTRLELQDLTNQLLIDSTIFLVTHDPLEALRLADCIYVMSGSPATLIEAMTVETEKPRKPNDPELLQRYAHLLELLYLAKGKHS
jgi:putative hydroxymethylpyrimidine transport system ATP-binding protein